MLLASRREETESEDYAILGDPGAVSRVGRKGGTRVFNYGQKSPSEDALRLERKK